MKHIYDKDFKYRSADHTDVRLTFERIRKELRDKDQRANANRQADVGCGVAKLPLRAGNSRTR
jgi:hypothetical protein